MILIIVQTKQQALNIYEIGKTDTKTAYIKKTVTNQSNDLSKFDVLNMLCIFLKINSDLLFNEFVMGEFR